MDVPEYMLYSIKKAATNRHIRYHVMPNSKKCKTVYMHKKQKYYSLPHILPSEILPFDRYKEIQCMFEGAFVRGTAITL